MGTVVMNDNEFEIIQRANEAEALEGFKQWIREQAQSLTKGAAWVARLDELGVLIEGVSVETLGLLRKIHRGLIDPSVITTFGHNTTAIEAISKLKIEDQKKLGAGEFLTVAEFQNGVLTTRKMNPRYMPPDVMKRVIQGGVILTPEQQIQLPPKQAKPKKVEAIKVDKKKHQLIVHGKAVQMADVRLTLSAASDTPAELVDSNDKMKIELARELVEKIDLLRKTTRLSRDQYILRLIRIAGY